MPSTLMSTSRPHWASHRDNTPEILSLPGVESIVLNVLDGVEMIIENEVEGKQRQPGDAC